jgi:general secretion pathway protein G
MATPGSGPRPDRTEGSTRVRAANWIAAASDRNHEFAQIMRYRRRLVPASDLRSPMTLPQRSALVRDGWRCRAEQGFTLLELLVVLAILGLLIGLVAPAALRQLGSAKMKIAHQSIERLASVLDIYKLDTGAYPTTEQGLQALISRPSDVENWSGPYLKGDTVPEDPWGRPFVYRMPSDRPGHDYDLYSLGPSGQVEGTDQPDKTLSN